jgi:hypothetical protein
MIDIEFDFQMDDNAANEDALFDPFELEMLFDQTRKQIEQHVQQRLGDMRCPDHDQPPRVKVTGVYSNETEQLDIQYHVDACCKLLLLKAVQALNQ